MAQNSVLETVKNDHRLPDLDLDRRIEKQTSRISDNSYFNLAIGSVALSAGLALFSRRKEFANFVGLWAPSLLLVGIYNKIARMEKSNPQESNPATL